LEHALSNDTLIDDSMRNVRTSAPKKSGSIGLFKGSFTRDSSKNVKISQNSKTKKAIIGSHSIIQLQNPNNNVTKVMAAKPKGRSMSLQNHSMKSANFRLEIPTWPRQEVNAPKMDKNVTPTKESLEAIQRSKDMQDLINERFPINKEFYQNYKLKYLLGDGAFGFVFTATDLANNKQVSSKLFLY
jgi:hypothetical protein